MCQELHSPSLVKPTGSSQAQTCSSAGSCGVVHIRAFTLLALALCSVQRAIVIARRATALLADFGMRPVSRYIMFGHSFTAEGVRLWW